MDQNDNKEFESYLKGDSCLSRAYAQLEKPEPSTQVEATILEEARHAVRKDQRKGVWFFSSRLDSPLGLAAVIMLCVSVVLLLSQQQGMEEDVIDSGLEHLKEDKPSRDSSIPYAEAEKNTLLREGKLKTDSGDMTETRKRAMSPAISTSVPERHRQTSIIAPENVSVQGFETAKEISTVASGNDAVADYSSPDKLVSAIREMIGRGRLDDAKKLYHRFLKQFPDQPVSEWFSVEERALLGRED